MEAKGEISMRMVHCEDCGKRYDYDVDGFCPRCGAFNQPVWVLFVCDMENNNV